MFTEVIFQQFDALKIEIQGTLTKLCAFKASRGHPSKMVELPLMSPGVLSRTIGDCVMNCFILCNEWSHLVVKHLRYHKFNHVPVNRICVVMSCLEMSIGKTHEIAFSMTVQKDF